MDEIKYESLLRPDSDPEFVFIDPPFTFNAADIVKYPLEVTGARLLRSMSRRLGWQSLAGKRLLDYGCGVRLCRTIINLGMDIGFYAGIDVNKSSIEWLRSNVSDPRFRFAQLDLQNDLYNKRGTATRDTESLVRLGFTDFDAICMFSVITHQKPQDAEFILKMLRSSVTASGALYFTALISDDVDSYAELNPEKLCMLSAYKLEFLHEMIERSGWAVSSMYAPSPFQQTAFVCHKRGDGEF